MEISELKNSNFIFLGNNSEKINLKLEIFLKKIYKDFYEKALESNLYIKNFETESGENYKKKDFDLLWEYLKIESLEIPRCIIIRKAERMTELVSSLFLKIMEKEIKNLYFFFTTENENKIIKTINSRSIIFFIEKSEKEKSELIELIFNKKTNFLEFENYLEEKNLSDIEIEELKEELKNKLISEKKIEILEKTKELFEKPIFPKMGIYFLKIIFSYLNN